MLKIWNPPLSERTGFRQEMKPWTPPSRRDGVRPGPQGKVVGVDEDDLRPELFEDGVGQPLDRALAGHGHEGGRFDDAVGRLEDRRPGRGGGIAGRRR